MASQVMSLKAFLFQRMYRHPRVTESVDKAKQVVRELFAALSADPGLLPADWAAACAKGDDGVTATVVRDYIAGMTDRYAILEHAKITHTEIGL
jgi:dGTPase